MDVDAKFSGLSISQLSSPPPPSRIKQLSSSSGVFSTAGVSDLKSGSSAAPASNSGLSERDKAIVALYLSSSGSSGALNYKHYIGTVSATVVEYKDVDIPYELNTIPQGNTMYSRIGNSWKNHKIRMHLKFEWALSTTTLTSSVIKPVRAILFVDTMPQVTGPILKTPSIIPTDFTALLCGQPADTHATAATMNPITHGVRFKILRDELIQPHNASVDFNATSNQTIGCASRDWDVHLGFGSTNGAASATVPDTNALMLFLVSDYTAGGGAAGSATLPTLTMTNDLMFSDDPA